MRAVNMALTEVTTSFEVNDPNMTTTGIDYGDAMFVIVLNSIVVPVLFGFITVVGLSGNGLVIYVIVTKRRMRTVTNLLLLNLAIADVCFVIVIPPFTAYMQATASWPFGDIACRLLHYLVNVTAYVTVYTLVLIAALRYATIVHSTATVRYRTRCNVILSVTTIWMLMLLVNSPILTSYGVVSEDGFVICDIKATDPTQVLNRVQRPQFRIRQEYFYYLHRTLQAWLLQSPYYVLPKYQINRLQHFHNALARTVVHSYSEMSSLA